MEHPLHQYQCRRTLVGGKGYDVYAVLDAFNFSSELPFKREYLATGMRDLESWEFAAEVNRLIEAAKKVAT